MNKATLKLTKIQSKALDFIRTSVERRGTAPTLRELCNHMGYSAIGSGQDLVAALRKKGFLYTPEKQTARSLVLSSRALALHEPQKESTSTTYAFPGFDRIPEDRHPLDEQGDAVCILKMSVALFQRPYPDPTKMFAWKASCSCHEGILKGDWLIFDATASARSGELVLVKDDGEATVRPYKADDEMLGKLVALQRVFESDDNDGSLNS